jgi:S-adenosylmethionine hydrolase
VGPDNGLLAPFLDGARIMELDAARLCDRAPSPTFHGRDLFAPAAARLARGEPADRFATPCTGAIAPAADRAYRIIHVDRFGNCITSIPAHALPDGPDAVLVAGGRRITRRVTTYAEATPGEAVYLIGSAGLVEIAVREGRAADRLALERGHPVTLDKGKTA